MIFFFFPSFSSIFPVTHLLSHSFNIYCHTIAYETEIYRNPLVHSFTGERWNPKSLVDQKSGILCFHEEVKKILFVNTKFWQQNFFNPDVSNVVILFWRTVWVKDKLLFNLLKLNDIFICRTAALTSRRYILNIYSTNIHTEYFKHAA